MEYETLNRDNVEALLRGETINIQRPPEASSEPSTPDKPADHGGRSTFPATKPRPAEA